MTGNKYNNLQGMETIENRYMHNENTHDKLYASAMQIEIVLNSLCIKAKNTIRYQLKVDKTF